VRDSDPGDVQFRRLCAAHRAELRAIRAEKAILRMMIENRDKTLERLRRQVKAKRKARGKSRQRKSRDRKRDA